MKKSRFFIDEPERELEWIEMKKEIQTWLLLTPVFTMKRITNFMNKNKDIF